MSPYSGKQPSMGLPFKVVLLLLIALVALGAAGFLVKKNSDTLKETLVFLSQRDPEIERLRNLLANLTEAENNFRIFSLTSDTLYLSAYNNLISRIALDLDTLRLGASSDQAKSQRLDSVATLLLKRQEMIDAFLLFKSKREGFDFAEKTIRQIKAGPLDTIPNSLRTSTRIITRYDTVLSDIQTQPEIVENQGLFRKIKKAFSKKNSEPETPAKKPVVLSTTRVITDTALIRPSDSLILSNIRKALVNVRQLDLATINRLRSQEVSMLRNSTLIINEVVSIFRQLESSQSVLYEKRALEARDKADKSIISIVIIGSTSLFLILLFVVLILSNIHRSNRYKRELIIAHREASELARVKEEFLANMSHEIRTPLNAIIGFSEQLGNTSLNQVQLEYLGAVRRSSKHLLETVNDILDLSKIGAGQLQLEQIPFRMHDVLEDVIIPFKLAASEKGISFEASCNIQPDIVLRGDPLRLKQILYNLLSNAIKFTSHGSVSIGCEMETADGKAVASITVSDTGIGIASDKLNAVFEDFIQGDSSQARRFGGTGLGLAISRRLAHLQHGDIVVASTEGQGSSFRVTIPFEISDEEPHTSEMQLPVSSEVLINKRLLLVDDDVFNILLARIIAENAGIIVEVASNGREAMELIGENTYDLVMTDVQMPEVSGIELVKFIRLHASKRISALPVIAFTASKIARFDPGYIEAGFNEVLQKPFTEADFLARMAGYFGNSLPESLQIQKPADEINKLYDLSQAELFASGNQNQFAGIIRSFIQTSQAATHELWKFYDNADYAGISALAHKMLTSYGHMGVKEALPLLAQLEKQDKAETDQDELRRLLIRITSINNRLQTMLETELLRRSAATQGIES